MTDECIIAGDLVPSLASSFTWNSPRDEFFTLMWTPRREKRTVLSHLLFFTYESSTLDDWTVISTRLWWKRWWRRIIHSQENWNRKMKNIHSPWLDGDNFISFQICARIAVAIANWTIYRILAILLLFGAFVLYNDGHSISQPSKSCTRTRLAIQ